MVDSEIIAALGGALIGIIGTYFTLRFSYNQLYAQTVSNNRMDVKYMTEYPLSRTAFAIQFVRNVFPTPTLP